MLDESRIDEFNHQQGNWIDEHQENIDFTYRALSVLNTAYCDLMMFLSPIKQKVSKPDRA